MLPVELHRIHGLPVRIVNSRPDIRTEQVVQRLDAALDLVATYAPHRYRRLAGDVQGLLVERFACRGAFFPQSREILVELTFTVNPGHTLEEIASSIVHEATHARVARRTGGLPDRFRPREERLCRREELAFGLALPDGAVVTARARASLELDAEEVAPVVDWQVAARRVADADRAVRRTV